MENRLTYKVAWKELVLKLQVTAAVTMSSTSFYLLTPCSYTVSRKRRRKGNPVANETIIYGYGSFRPLVREVALLEKASTCQTKERKIWSWTAKGDPTPRRTRRVTVGRKFNSTSSCSWLYLYRNARLYHKIAFLKLTSLHLEVTT
jgi:hypothetical protein